MSKLEELLRSTLADPPGPEVPGTGLADAAVRQGLRRRASRRRSALAGAVVVIVGAVVAAGLAEATSSPTRPAGTSLRIVPPPTLPMATIPKSIVPPPTSLAPSNSTPTTLAPGEQVLPLAFVQSMTSDASAVYVESTPSPTPGDPYTVTRIDLATGRRTRSAPVLAYAGNLVRTGNSLWAVNDAYPNSNAPTTSSHATLVQFDPVTLAVRQRIPLPDDGASLAGSLHLLWVGASTRLLRLDPDTGRVLATVPLQPGESSDVSIDPTEQRLYVVQGNVGLDPNNPNKPYTTGLLTERRATDGSLLTSENLTSIVGGTAWAVNNGVWVSFPTGMQGRVELLRASDLSLVATFVRSPDYSGTNSVLGTISGGLLWVTDQVAPVDCADPTNGKILGALPITGGPVVSGGNHVYVSTGQGLVVLPVPSPCRS